MPKLFLSVLICLAFFQVQAQLSRSETIVYIQKKMKEIDGHYRYFQKPSNSGQVKMVYSKLEFGVSDTKESVVVIGYSRKPDEEELESDDSKYSFNPAHISSIVVSQTNATDPVGILSIHLTGKVGIKSVRYSGGDVVNESTNVMLLPFLQSDATNINKLKKALEHLKTIYKKEMDADPFGN